ncbi:MAG: GntR family transcriptional regulator [Planctomycetota bacterium]
MTDTTFRIAPGEVKSLSGLVADKLMQSVMSGLLKPGENLVQNDLAARFGVSRVAIRDALQELRIRGLAINVPQKGTIVRPITKKRVEELFAVRKLLEPAATRLATAKLNSDAKKRLTLLLKKQQLAGEEGDMAQAIDLDWEFHQTIYRAGGNQALLEMITELWSQSRQARGIAKTDAGWGHQWNRASLSRHRKILSAIKRGDVDLSSQLVGDGIDAALSELAVALESTDWWEAEST